MFLTQVELYYRAGYGTFSKCHECSFLLDIGKIEMSLWEAVASSSFIHGLLSGNQEYMGLATERRAAMAGGRCLCIRALGQLKFPFVPTSPLYLWSLNSSLD
jgi:hypothetical protein